jgi:oligopeptide/dipeptide ABC transporter ATP-binding protein
VSAILRAEHLVKHYPIVRTGVVNRAVGAVRAVEDVSFELHRGETLAIVGESGCGKSTLGRLLVRLERPTGGRVLLEGTDVAGMSGDALRAFRRRVQIVFQDPYSSLNPTMTVGSLVTEPWRIHRTVPHGQRASRAKRLLGSVGLDTSYYGRRPSELSGGERQRVGIARALALEPEVIVCDEPASALDVSVQAQVMALLQELQRDLGLSYVFISHDLSVVRYLAHRVAVMYLGRIVEIGPCEGLYEHPHHPYTRGLLDAAHQLHGEAAPGAVPLMGETPDAAHPPSGCRFHPRCSRASSVCRDVEPVLTRTGEAREMACYHPYGVELHCA